MFTGLLVFSGLIACIYADCSPYNGPASDAKCVSFPSFNNESQWASCLTDAYVKEKSEGKHGCDQGRTYCYYQCMCELYDKCDGGSVKSDCACVPSSNPHAVHLASRPIPSLPAWCFSPSGSRCSWYEECLEQRHRCENTDAVNVITYAKKFCDLNSGNYGWSSDGQRWTDAASKCLLVELVPALHQIDTSCSDVEAMALASHPNCSAISDISYCSLEPEERLKIFWTIKAAFTTAFVNVMEGLWKRNVECAGSILNEIKVNTLEAVYIDVKNFSSPVQNIDDFRGQIVNGIAKKFNWRVKGLDWYVPAATSNPKSRVKFLLVSKREYDLNAPTTPVVDVNAEVASLADSVNDDLGPLTVYGVPINVLSMAACSNIHCTSTYLEMDVSVGTGFVPRVSYWFLLLVCAVVLFNCI